MVTSILRQDYLSQSKPEEYKGKSFSFTLNSISGNEAVILSYGALIASLDIIREDGTKVDVVLGLKGLDEYMASMSNHGAVVGRCANRTKGAKLSLNGREYNLPVNDGPNNLHGGSPSYQNVFWEAEILNAEKANDYVESSRIIGVPELEGEALLLRYMSPDGSCGFPGNLDSQVFYAWAKNSTLLIIYRGQSDSDTVFAPTNHSYFNLAGHNSGSVSDNLLMINSDSITLKDSENCPTGEISSVDGTIFDFREMDFVEKVLNEDNPQTATSRGIDQNYCIHTSEGSYSYAASLTEPESGLNMDVYTDMPGLQVYCGNHLGGNDQKGEIPYSQYGAICLEAQMYPNAINISSFASPVIKKNEVKYHICGYSFD
ncbi:MAG TPA: aldose epimerase family protein [Saccharofermentans sp.]|nr:aldose epimerase family protein [Saccharofermentans sp.]HPE27489.1 aldose epimerase family protein [Saccharofermentans sp.]HPJ81382.1 aldose epimerase family protein [Saccharofermentans sp.]HPQ32410.1 aldose epimerase family protein [Saccharofermentans sp.]HRV51171.1 aldose epimerase family protein [Saccharofermentans sp.]